MEGQTTIVQPLLFSAPKRRRSTGNSGRKIARFSPCEKAAPNRRKRGTDIGKEAYSKQFAYAKNVIQWHLNVLLGDESATGYGGSHNLQDPVTEGYDVIPNFFISAAMNENLDFESDDLKPTQKDKKDCNRSAIPSRSCRRPFSLGRATVEVR